MVNSAAVRRAAGQVGLGVAGIAAVTFGCFWLHVDLAIAAFLYLLTVVLLSPRAGFASSAIVSCVAVLCLDYFFTQPLLQLEVASPLDGAALATYLVTSLIITRLASKARQKASMAERREAALGRLYEIVWRLFSIEPCAVTGLGTLQIFREVLDMEGICLMDGSTGRLEISGTLSGELATKTRAAYELGYDTNGETADICVQSLQVAGRRVGAIGFQGLADPASVAAPLAMLAGAALERATSFQEANAAAAASQAEALRAAIVDAFAHQFKTPLAAILAAAGGIRETQPLTKPQLEMIDMIEVETVRLNRLATRLLATAKLDRNEVKPRLEATNLGDLIERIVTQVPGESHSVLVERGSALIEVAADQELLTLAVSQLLDNAFKYSPGGSAVQIRLAAMDGEALVRVKNRGAPIAPEERERIFERFYRGAAAKRLAAGTGLGLYVARKIVHAHTGTLTLQEEPATGEGVTFLLKLPLLEVKAQHARKAS